MVDEKNFVQVDIGEIENVCFVVMPFDPLFQTQYERVIRPAIEELGIRCIRGDEIYSKPNIMSDIWKSIRKSLFVVAELTGRNPNVFYEVGLAHAIGKPIILLTRSENDVPFDLKSLRYRYYDVNDPFWGENLRTAIQSMARMVIEQPDLSTHLEDITPNVHISSAPKGVTPLPLEKEPSIDVSGIWKVTWKDSAPDSSEHHGVIYISQQQDQLSGTMTISVEWNDGIGITVVQEVLTGTIDGINVSLNGVSYTYAQQGPSPSYNLDGFKLELTADRNLMIGLHYDERYKGKTTFTKQENI